MFLLPGRSVDKIKEDAKEKGDLGLVAEVSTWSQPESTFSDSIQAMPQTSQFATF